MTAIIKNKVLWSVMFLILALGALPFLDLSASGQIGAAGANAVVPYATAVPAPIDLKTAPVTVYRQVDGYPLVTWDTLAHFAYDTPDIEEEIDPRLRLKKKKPPVPDFVKRLNGQSIATVGFLIPVDTNEAGDKATSFILARTQATCCYGITPKMNEWMFVQMVQGKAADATMDVPVTVFGTLAVGEEKKENMGWSLYRMAGQKVSAPHSWW